MALTATLLLLLACGSLSEGSSQQHLTMPGVNSRKGSTREPQPFHCTNDMKETTATTRLMTQTKPSAPEQQPERLTSTPPTSPPCAPNMVLGPSCDCKKTCQDPTSCDCTGPETCVCPDGFVMNNSQCIHEQECECYYRDGGEGVVIPDGATQVTENCSERCTCSDDSLSCDSTYKCSPHAVCKVKDNVRQCYCNDGYVGDGETCKLYTDCYDAYQAGQRQSGVFTILPSGWPSYSPFKVYCNMTTDGGGWTVFQRRVDLITDFRRNWTSYKVGFGSFEEDKDFWLGNEKLHYLTQQRNYKLRVDMRRNNGWRSRAEYDSFVIGTELENYTLSDLGNKKEHGGDGMWSAEGKPFSTYDKDNVGCSEFSCVERHGGGGWWYSGGLCNHHAANSDCSTFRDSRNYFRRCSTANLNGKYDGQYHGQGISWKNHCNIKSVEMKIRPKEMSTYAG